jgi:hypothetical protein
MIDEAFKEDLISRLALAVKQAYCLLRKMEQRIPTYNPPDKKYGKYWRDAAMICLHNRIHPTEFVEVQFHALKPWPEITNISSTAALERYRMHAKNYAIHYMVGFNVQMQAYENTIKSGRDPKDILTDPNLDFDPLFTYVAAVAGGFEDLVKEHEASALAQYLSSIHYDQLYKDAIPEKFKRIGKEMREGVNA